METAKVALIVYIHQDRERRSYHHSADTYGKEDMQQYGKGVYVKEGHFQGTFPFKLLIKESTHSIFYHYVCLIRSNSSREIILISEISAFDFFASLISCLYFLIRAPMPVTDATSGRFVIGGTMTLNSFIQAA